MSGYGLVLAICTLNRPNDLDRLMACLAAQDWRPGNRILVVDNDAEQSSRSVVEKAQSSLPIPLDYLVEGNRGFASVRNRVLREVPSSSAVLFLDDDAVVPSDWIETMERTHLLNPTAIVRSRYVHVADLPKSVESVSSMVANLDAIASFEPAGTSGLLLPPDSRLDLRFDPYFDLSGGEDVHLLAVLDRRGFQTVLAPTLVLEKARTWSLSRREQLLLAQWNGRLAAIVRQRAGFSMLSWRLESLRLGLLALVKGLVRELTGNKDAATGHLTYAAGLFAQVTSASRTPDSLGARPTF